MRSPPPTGASPLSTANSAPGSKPITPFRPHQALGYLTPLEFLQELQRGATKDPEL